MKFLIVGIALSLVTLVSLDRVMSSESAQANEHTKWLATSFKEMETVKAGMTRGELLKVFKEEGGISTRSWQRYAYRDCSFIKVDVEFNPVDDPGNGSTRSSSDQIVKISKPFLEWSIID